VDCRADRTKKERKKKEREGGGEEEEMDSSQQHFYDDAFAHIAHRAGSVNTLLEEFFSFLHRRTDFYVQFPSSNPSADAVPVQYSMGFPEGVAKQMVLKAFGQFPLRDYATEKDKYSTTSPRKIKPLVPTTTIDYNGSSGRSSDSFSNSKPTNTATITGSFNTPTKKKPIHDDLHHSPTTTTTTTPDTKTSFPTVQYSENGAQIPIGNGGVGPNYYWTQTLKDITIYVDLVGNVSSKLIEWDLKPSKLTLRLKGGTDILSGDLEETIRTSDSTWTLSKGSDQETPQVIITLEKIRETWWKHVLVGHPEIDTSKVSYCLPKT
jgi:hypothetical protein